MNKLPWLFRWPAASTNRPSTERPSNHACPNDLQGFDNVNNILSSNGAYGL